MAHSNKPLPVLLAIAFFVAGFGIDLPIARADEAATGPANLMQTLKTPFGSGSSQDNTQLSGDDISLEPIAISQLPLASRLGLKERLNAPYFFLPDRLVMGKSCEFTVKGPGGSYVAVAMADKNTGAKPIYGHKLRLGSDRKVVAVGQIPSTGVLSLYIETPIQGDMVDSSFFFEAAVWSKPDFSDLQMARVVPVQKNGSDDNGAVVAEETVRKKDGLFKLDTVKSITGISNPNNRQSQMYGGVHP
jgi:hypothetical protein